MKVAIVTGASRGIGRACAIKLAQVGYTVVINYASNDAKAQEVLDLIKANGGDGMLYKANVSNYDEVKQMVKTVFDTYKQIDLLVNNAGIVRDEPLIGLNKENLDMCFDLNVKGYFYCAKEVALKMARKRSGVIVNMSSVSGTYSLPGQTVYSATKGAVNQFTKTLAKEMGSRGLRVNAVAPGFIETDMIEAVDEATMAKYLEAIPLRRRGKVEEVANLVAFLASDDASYITGQIITLDGGLSL
ncbi:MAG: 3-oxoacyl-ACP reductase FabG [Acholeplasmatales bacterium]|jgi:3-oxoacyl-[acyl-carrier protein] reductase|nr:3-oxoacyl-ACP reductase FabG [Acholeplasmatales bacterium]